MVRYHNLTTAQSDRLEALQKRALRIITHPITLPYNCALAYCEKESVKLRRHNFPQKFFNQICHPGNCLRDLLPPKRDPSVSLRLRYPTVYPLPSGPNETVLLLHKLLLKVLPVTSFHVRNSVIFILYFISSTFP